MLAMIVRLVGSMPPNCGAHISILQRLQAGTFFDCAQLVWEGMMLYLTQVQKFSLKSFGYGSVLCSILYEKVVMLCHIIALLAAPP